MSTIAWGHSEDEYGCLAEAPLEVAEFEPFEISRDAFELVWRKQDVGSSAARGTYWTPSVCFTAGLSATSLSGAGTARPPEIV